MTPAETAHLKQADRAAPRGRVSGQAGQAPSVVKVRLPGTSQDITAVAGRLTEADDITVLDQSGAYPNRRDPGMRGLPDRARERDRAMSAGVVYLLHLDAPGIGHAKHYTGWAADLDARLAQHDAGRGARLLAVARAAGIGWTLARTWPGSRARERQLKRQGGASRRCPLCGVRPRGGVS